MIKMMFPSRLFIFLTLQLLSYNHNMVTAQCQPHNVVSTQVLSTQLSLSWRCYDIGGDDQLQVTYRLTNRGQCDPGDGSEDPPFDIQNTQWGTWNRQMSATNIYDHSATLTNLLPYSTYIVSVRSRQPDGVDGYYIPTNPAYIDPNPTTSEAAPGTFGAESISFTPYGNRLYFSWTIPCGSRNGLISDYQYILRDVSNNIIIGATTIDAYVTIIGLSCDITYKFHVAGINSEGAGAYSEYKTATTTCCTRGPGPVGNLGATSVSATTIGLSWSAPTDIGCPAQSSLQYDVRYSGNSLQSGCTLPTSQGSVTIQHLDYTISSLTPYYEYTVGVFAVGGDANRRTIKIITMHSVPGAVQTLRITAASSTSLDVSWNAPINECPPDFYTVATQLANRDQCLSIPDVLIPAGSPTSLSYEVTGLTPYSTYTVYITPVNTAGNGMRSDVSGTTAQTEPSGPPVNVMVSEVGQRYLSFTWMQPMCGQRKGDIMKYSYVLTDLYRNTVMSSDTSDTSIVLNDLTPYVRYGFKVSAWTSVGQGPFSDLIVNQTLEDKPPAPLKPTVANADTMSITFHWLPPDPPNGVIIGYDVQYWDTTNNMMSANIENTIFMEYIVTGLKANDQISFQVRAQTSAGKGNWSEVATGEAKEGIPDPPTDFTASRIEETSVTLHWNIPTNQNGAIQNYIIEYRVVERAYDPTFSPDEEYASINDDVAGNANTLIIEDLDPSSKYEFKISARTSAGRGTFTSLEVFTKLFTGLNQPNSPAVKIVNGVGIIVFNDLPEFVSNVYIAVENANSRRRRQVGKYPIHAFIVANLTRREVEESMTFTVGDNKTYRGYVNHALIGGQSYGIKVAYASCTPEGCLEEWSSLSIFTDPSGAVNQSGTFNPLGPIIGGVVAVILIGVVFITLICYYRRNRASTKETPKETAKDENEIYDEIDPKKEMMAKQLQRSQTEETGYEVNMAMETKMSPRAQSDGSAYEDVNIKEEAEYQGLNLDAVDEEQIYQDLKGNASGDKSAPQYANV